VPVIDKTKGWAEIGIVGLLQDISGQRVVSSRTSVPTLWPDRDKTRRIGSRIPTKSDIEKRRETWGAAEQVTPVWNGSSWRENVV